jgi:hypothetical protein
MVKMESKLLWIDGGYLPIKADRRIWANLI